MTPARAEAGFTLIEILVAFTIAAILLVVLLRNFSGGISSSARSEARAEALTIAEVVLETLGTELPLVDGYVAQQSSGQFRLATSVRRYGPPLPGRASIGPFELRVVVSWQEGRQPHSVVLRTLRFALP